MCVPGSSLCGTCVKIETCISVTRRLGRRNSFTRSLRPLVVQHSGYGCACCSGIALLSCEGQMNLAMTELCRHFADERATGTFSSRRPSSLHCSAIHAPHELLVLVLRSLCNAWCTTACFGNTPTACVFRCGFLGGDCQVARPPRHCFFHRSPYQCTCTSGTAMHRCRNDVGHCVVGARPAPAQQPLFAACLKVSLRHALCRSVVQ